MANSPLVTEENYNVGGHLTYGRQGTKIDRIVLHHNAATTDVIPGVWQNRAASAHYQVTPNAIRQCVDEGNTAWHCLPLDSTEVLTPDGFTLLGDLSVGDEVVSYDHETGNLKVSTVKRVVAPREEEVIRYKYIEATAQHKFLVKSVGSSNFVDKTWSDVVNGTQYVLPMPNPIENEGINLTDDEIRYLVAVQADGCYVSPIGNRKTSDVVRFGFRKPRKIQRMKELLDRLGIDYKTYHEKNGKTVRYSISDWYGGKSWCEDYLDGKAFSDKFLGMNSHQTEVFFNELREWDGTININNQLQYTSTSVENVELVQAILFLSQGKSAHIYKSVGKGNRRDLYTIAVPSGRGHVTISSNSRDKLTRRVTTVSCIEVDTGYIVVRQHGLVFITGNCGNWAMNLRSIGIEHLNSTGAPNWDVADETEERSAALVADICKRHGIPCDRSHILKHSQTSATACPGGLDVDKIVRRANEIMGGASANIPAAPSTPPVTESTSTGWCYFDYRGNVRQQPTTESAIMATYNAGTWVEYVGFVHGQTVNGSDKWLKSKVHGWYVHESVTSGTWGLKDLGTVNTPSSGGHPMTLIHDVRGNWRDQPNTQSGVFATYNAGAQVACKGWVYGEDPYGDGNNKWVVSSRNGKYAWSGIFGGTYDLPYIGS